MGEFEQAKFEEGRRFWKRKFEKWRGKVEFGGWGI